MNIKELLNNPILGEYPILAGSNGLNREITQVGMIDAPDFDEYVTSGQLILTTGFLFKNNWTLLRELIITMDKHNAAGLGIKMSRYLSNLPRDIIVLANKHRVPILMTPNNELLPQTIQNITDVILNTRTSELHEIVNINHRLSEMQNNNTYQHLLNLSAEILDASLTLLDSHFRALYASTELLPQRDFFTTFLREKSGIDYLNLTQKVHVTFHNNVFEISPIFSALNENKAFVAIMSSGKTLSDFELLKREQVITALGFSNSRTDLLNETEFRNRSGFFLNIMQHGLSNAAIDNYLKNAGIDSQNPYRVAVIDFTRKKTVIETHQFEILQALTRWFINEFNWSVLIFSYKQQLILLIDNKIDTRKFLKQLYNFLTTQEKLAYTFTIGFSRVAEPIHTLADLYEQANHALQLTSSTHPIMRFRPKSAQEMLDLLPKQESDAFVERILGPILDNPSLLKTLETYMFLHQNVTAVASDMFVHRNTINYRLKRISELLDVNLDMPDVLVDIQLAFLLLN
ncbi:purine transport regulator [Leuconostoc litchii]|uniref:PucR family transcriptional regulator n=1 Tax=Leuconostoc litchii TaxID=1981069 RepID=A0A6P2CLC1_9LACO|nr:PucR family transcriptional regulator [Leuconostoc litchii]TYC46780.1 PucR family transcriptional regulator [Leuconostoc litchii]GMA70667.1 purine transport regulator [Leuconostoc litchii]